MRQQRGLCKADTVDVRIWTFVKWKDSVRILKGKNERLRGLEFERMKCMDMSKWRSPAVAPLLTEFLGVIRIDWLHQWRRAHRHNVNHFQGVLP